MIYDLLKRQGKMVEQLEKMMQAAVGEIETALDNKRVIGDPITVGDYTIIPLISVGFAVGVGSGTGKSDELIKGEGFGGASAGGGGLKPVAVVVIGPDGAKVEHLKGTAASLFETLAANVKNTRWKKNHED